LASGAVKTDGAFLDPEKFMPALDKGVIEDLELRLRRYLDSSGGYEELKFLDAGGSAAVYMVRRENGLRAVKVFDPELFTGSSAASSRRRLDVQRRLVEHACPSLIQTYFAAEAEDTAFIEMEFIDWPQLTKLLNVIPDDAVGPLMSQLVGAVRFLESLNIVHRDIKPENIHVSTDFTQLKLLDLGVAREFDLQEENEAAITDAGARRPFLATAQYSPPEYLFRLDEPTKKLWRGLNFYQVGAVLHDLIKKEQLFQHEISMGNRWLVARAVLTKPHVFSDADQNRLSAEKAVALRCLTKDLDTRLALVGWEDFQFDRFDNPLSALKSRLAKGPGHLGELSKEASTARLQFERNTYFKRIIERVRTELLEACGNQLPLTMKADWTNTPSDVSISLMPSKFIGLGIYCRAEWGVDLYENCAHILVGAKLLSPAATDLAFNGVLRPVFEATIGGADDEVVNVVSSEIAKIINSALSRIEAAGEGVELLYDTAV
jgi:eukaryotic-like serine/threonine-protein kinase